MSEEFHEFTTEQLIRMVCSPARFDDPLIAAIGDVWVMELPELRDTVIMETSNFRIFEVLGTNEVFARIKNHERE